MRRSSESLACASERAGSRSASSKASFVGVETRVCLPLTSHHVAAMPAASARASMTSALGGRARSPSSGASASVRIRAARAAISTLSAVSVAASTLESSLVSIRMRQAMPARGSGSRRVARAAPRLKAIATRSTPPATGALKTATRMSSGRASHWAPDVIAAFASRHSTSGRPVASKGCPESQDARPSAGCSRRAAARRPTKAANEASAVLQSIHEVALSCA